MGDQIITRPGYWKKGNGGLVVGWEQAIVYLAPHNEAFEDDPRYAGRTMCAGHSPECFKFCLIHSGRMISAKARAARKRRTLLLLENPEEFGRLLVKEVESHVRRTRKHGMLPAVRFNGTSDWPWETWPIPHLGQTIHRYLLDLDAGVQVSEYTKRYGPYLRWLGGEYPENLYMTFSLHEMNRRQALDILDRGGNVAVVFRVKKGHPLPTSWWGWPVLDGDGDDLRWLDNERARFMGSTGGGLIIGLRHKGKLARTVSPFSLDPTREWDLLRDEQIRRAA